MSRQHTLERRQLTVLLCDLVAWTALAQHLDPEELAELVQAYRRRCAATVAAHGGTIAQYVGDGVLAYFGYPRAHEDDAERAIRAALAIAVAERTAAGDSNVHIGIATGTLVVSTGEPTGRGVAPGAEAEVSAVGSALNLAARLQTLAEPGMVVVSAETRRLAGGLFDYRDLGQHVLKGFEAAVPAWQVLGERGVRSRFHALRASNLTPFVGREAALDVLRGAWDRVRQGSGQAVLLTGEPGVGKSRLAEVVDARIVGRDCLRLWYYASPNLQGSPFAPVIRYLSFAAGLSPADDDATRLARLTAFVPEALRRSDDALPLLGGLLGVVAPAAALQEMSPQRHRQRLLQVLVALLHEFAQRGPVLLVVEDLHWLDPSSDELIGRIVDALPTLPLLLVLTARPEFQPPWDERAQLRQLPLVPLGRDETRKMIGLLCGEHALPAATIEQIAERTDGLPLFVEDLTRDLLEHDASAARAPGAAPAIPATLSDSLMSRLDRLGPAKAVAQVGAVIGREFSHELLAKVAERDEETLKEDLLRLLGAGLLVSRRPGAVPIYAFKHALVRDAAYASLLKKELAALHGRIAQVLAEDFAETAAAEPVLLAHHYAAAHDDTNAVRCLVQAAKLSARRCGFVEAIAQLERALQLLAVQEASPQRARLELRVQLALGGVYAEYRGFASAHGARAYDRALVLCRELGDPPEVFAVLSGIGAVEITRAGFARCRALAEETLRRAAAQTARSPFVMGHLLLGGTQFLCGELDAARQHLDEALRIYEQQHAAGRAARQVMYVQDQKSTGLCYLALALTIGGEPAAGRRAALEGLAHSEALGGAHTINFSRCYLAATLHIQRDHAGALTHGLQSLQAAREQGFATWIGPSAAIVGAQRVHHGEVEQGLEQICDGIRDYVGTQALAYQPFWFALRAEGLAAAGRLDEACAGLDEAIGIAVRHGERFYLGELLRFKGEISARLGRSAEAERCLYEALAVARSQRARLFELRIAATLCRTCEGSRRRALLDTVLAPLLQSFGEANAHARDVVEAAALLGAPAA